MATATCPLCGVTIRYLDTGRKIHFPSAAAESQQLGLCKEMQLRIQEGETKFEGSWWLQCSEIKRELERLAGIDF